MVKYLVGAPMERIGIDILGPLPESASGNRYILVVCDYFTKWTGAWAIPNTETITVVTILINQFISIWGVPLHIYSDRGSQFESDLFQTLCKELGILKTRTTAYHPQSDGLVERFNRTLEAMISKYIADHQRNWDEHLQLLMLAYRTSVHNSTGFSPAMLMCAWEPRLPLDLMFGSPPQEADSSVTFPLYLDNLRNNMRSIHELARKKLLEASERQKRHYDLHENCEDYKPGDPVWVHSNKRKKGLTPKLQNRWDGP